MALLSNVPTLSYIRWQNLLITYQGTTYQISNNQTNKAYIYWDVGNPTELIASSRKLEEKSGQFYIFFNERGRYTVVPNDEIEINFSEGGAREAMTDTIIGFGQKIDANTQKFSTIEADIDGLKTTVGEIQNNIDGGSSSTISKIEQKVDQIELEVEHIERSFNEEQSMNNLRNNVSSSILSLQSTLGQFSSDMNTIMSDNKLSSEENTQISSYTSSLSSSLSSVTSQIDSVISHFQEQGDSEKVTRLTTAKNNLTNAVQNLTKGISTASTDNIFTNSEITTIISYFGKANTSINEAKNLIDDYILLGVGGDLVEEVSRITLRQDEINLNVSRNEQTVSEDLSNLKQRVNEAELKITDDAIISTVSSTFYNKTEINDIVNDLTIEGGGGITFAVNNVDVMYYLSNSATELSGGSWSTTPPTWQSGKYIWSKTVTTFTDGSTKETNPVCITGAKGETGADGRSVTSITEEYYLSTSKTTQEGGSWVTTPPTWEKGKYMWTRSKIVYDNPYGVEYTTPICDSSWDITNDLSIEIETTKKTVAEHAVELESITSKVQTNSSTILRIDGEIDSVETRVSSAEQKITDEAIINTVTSSSNWIESVGGVNLIPNPTAKYDLEGWLSMTNNNITRYENNQIYYDNGGGTGVNISGSVNGDLVENVSTLSYSYLHVLEPRGGGGLALLIQDKSGQTIMIDGGYEANASHCISYLNSLGIKKLDYYIISHAHSDHIEGAIDILEYFNAKKVIIKRLDTSKLPSVELEWRTDTLYNEFMNMCTRKGVEVIDPSSYNHIKISDDSYIKIYNTGNLDWTNYNSQSLMLLYVYKNNKVFLACDGTHNASNSAIGLIGKVDIFQAGHHGDGTEGGSSQKLIDELQPKHTIFASDWLSNNIDQTKEGETLNRVSYYGGLSYSHGTGHNGDYVFTLNGSTVSTSAKSIKAQSSWHLRDNGKYYWFKANGTLAKNETITISDKNYRFKADGVAYYDEWYQDSSSNYYYYDPSCAMAVNAWWQDKYGNWFYLQSGGVMAVNKVLTISSKEYRFKADGIAYCNEWYQNTSTKYWYFYGEYCAMLKNAWRENKFGEWYWLKSNGVMASNETLTINGVSRTFNDQGVCINPN